MKRITLAIFFTFATCAAFAQGTATQKAPVNQASGEKTIEERASEITASMASHLRLSPDQTKKLMALNLRCMISAEEAKDKYKAEPREMVRQMDIINQTRLSQIKDILTPYQFQQYQQRREEKMGVPKEAQSNPASRQQGSRYQQEQSY
ncbi:hypothetical protein ACSX1A_09440 [Pontibacter sp. MBLB2868]|uniref:hypothetical protein n=1 Tax=Pontibacter sp. MBLB2868 TaxID=3451555 RepID=UPI003F75279A